MNRRRYDDDSFARRSDFDKLNAKKIGMTQGCVKKYIIKMLAHRFVELIHKLQQGQFQTHYLCLVRVMARY